MAGFDSATCVGFAPSYHHRGGAGGARIDARACLAGDALGRLRAFRTDTGEVLTSFGEWREPPNPLLDGGGGGSSSGVVVPFAFPKRPAFEWSAQMDPGTPAEARRREGSVDGSPTGGSERIGANRSDEKRHAFPRKSVSERSPEPSGAARDSRDGGSRGGTPPPPLASSRRASEEYSGRSASTDRSNEPYRRGASPPPRRPPLDASAGSSPRAASAAAASGFDGYAASVFDPFPRLFDAAPEGDHERRGGGGMTDDEPYSDDASRRPPRASASGSGGRVSGGSSPPPHHPNTLLGAPTGYRCVSALPGFDAREGGSASLHASVVAGTSDGRLRLFDLAAERPCASWRVAPLAADRAGAVVATCAAGSGGRDDAWLCAVTSAGVASLVDRRCGTLAGAFNAHRDAVVACAAVRAGDTGFFANDSFLSDANANVGGFGFSGGMGFLSEGGQRASGLFGSSSFYTGSSSSGSSGFAIATASADATAALWDVRALSSSSSSARGSYRGTNGYRGVPGGSPGPRLASFGGFAEPISGMATRGADAFVVSGARVGVLSLTRDGAAEHSRHAAAGAHANTARLRRRGDPGAEERAGLADVDVLPRSRLFVVAARDGRVHVCR